MDKKITFYFVRHGETLFNKLGRVQGWCDSPLTGLGIMQAKAVGLSLRNTSFDSVYCSTLARAVDTANYIAGDRDLGIHYLKNLREMNFGMMEGALESHVSQDVKEREWGGRGWKDVGGDDRDSIEIRIKDAFAEMTEDAKDGDDILVITHGAFLMHMLMYITKDKIKAELDGNRDPIPNCSVSLVNYEDGQYSLKGFADTSYLENGMMELEGTGGIYEQGLNA